MARRRPLHREFQVVGFYLSAHPLDEYKRRCRRCGAELGRIFRRSKAWRHRRPLAGTGTTKQERNAHRNKMGVVAFSDTSGQYEAVLFSEGLAQYRDLLEPPVRGYHRLLPRQAGRRQSAHQFRPGRWRMRQAGSRGTRISCETPRRSTRLPPTDRQGEGQVSFVLIKEEGEGRSRSSCRAANRISPQIASAMRAVPGVVEVNYCDHGTARPVGGPAIGYFADRLHDCHDPCGPFKGWFSDGPPARQLRKLYHGRTPAAFRFQLITIIIDLA